MSSSSNIVPTSAASVPFVFSIQADGISAEVPERKLGVRHLQLRLTIEGKPWVVRYDQVQSTHAVATDSNNRVRVTTKLRSVNGLSTAAVFEHTLENLTSSPIWVSDLATGQFAADAGVKLGAGHGLGWDYRYTHTDNVRTERYPHCMMDYPLVRVLPIHRVKLGAGQDQPFPAVYFSNTSTGDGLVIAAASQNNSLQTYELQKGALDEASVFDTFLIHHESRQSGGFEIAPSCSITLDGVYVQTLANVHPQRAYEGYLSFLNSEHTFRGPTTKLLTEALHCTWNYGVFHEQYEEALLKTASFIAKELPGIKWFLMDDGYMSILIPPKHTANFLDRYYPDPDANVDKKKFPQGIRHYSDAVRALGLRPGIWWSPTTRIDSQIYRDHPDWFLRDTKGGPYLIGKFNGFLDLTVPGARDFMERTIEHMTRRWGFDAMKMDFWSQQFEDSNGRLAQPSMNVVHTRTIMFDLIRKYLPADGVFVTCVATGMGNPFIGKHADSYRNTIDIGEGDWRHQQLNSAWTLPTALQAGRSSLLLDQDSAGINLQCPDNENTFRLTWCFITMGMQEMGGRVEQLPEQWVNALRKYTDRCDRGYPVRCPDERAFTGVPLPECLYVDFPAGSRTAAKGVRQSVAFFNWSDQPRVVSVRRADLRHEAGAGVENFWTGQAARWDNEFVTVRLGPRSAELWDVLS